MAGERQRMTIGELCDNGIAALQTGPFGTQLHAYDYTEHGVPIVPTEAIRNRRIDQSVLPLISAGKAKELARHRLEIGDILFARRGVQATGHIGVVRKPEVGFICGTGAIRLRVAKGNRVVDPDFLSHVLANPRSVEWFKFHAIGATMPNLNEGIIRSFSFEAPPLPEQREIANILSSLEEKIELNRRMNETLEDLTRAIFTDWFVDFGPTRAKVDGRAPYLGNDVWDLFPDRLDDGGGPVGWRAGSLADLIEVNPAEVVKKGELAPYLPMAALPTQGSITDLPILREYSSGTKFRNGDTLLARITPCLENGKTAFVHNLPEGAVGWGSTEFIVMRSIAPVPKPVSYLLARDPAFRRHAIQSMNGTSGRQRASAEGVARYPVFVPDDNRIWTALESLLTPPFERISANAAETQTLTETRDLLLPNLMSGAIGMKDAGRVNGVSA